MKWYYYYHFTKKYRDKIQRLNYPKVTQLLGGVVGLGGIWI